MATNSNKRLLRTITLGLLGGSLFLTSCNKKEFFDGPNAFEDSFESYSTLEDLLPEGDSLWSFTQITLEGNSITVDSTFAHTGSKCLRFEDVGTQGDLLSKCSIAKQNMAFWEGDVVNYSFWAYLESGSEADWLFLSDLEEQAVISAGPGIRLAIIGDSAIVAEHKYPNPNLHQEEGEVVTFPRDEWVLVEFAADLSQKKEGYVRVWQDNQLIIKQDEWQTLPKDILTFQQGTKGMYSSIEIGITANPGSQPHVLYIDDFRIGLR